MTGHYGGYWVQSPASLVQAQNGRRMNPYNPTIWQSICHNVSEIALNIFPHIKSKKLKSEIISNLFETQSAKYLNQQGFHTLSAESDREPDLLINNNPCEIKEIGRAHV